MPDTKFRDLVLVGGGHAHVFVLKKLAMEPVAGLRTTLITREAHTPYSGMLPGLIAGHYGWDDIHIDLAPLCAAADVRLIAGSVHGLDLDARTLACDDRPPIRFDLLSIDCGSAPGTSDIDGADRTGVTVKPISRFLPRWHALLDRIRASDSPLRLAIVGGGAGGAELALSIDHRLRRVEGRAAVEISLISADRELVTDHNARVRARLGHELARRGIAVHLEQRIQRADPGRLTTASGQAFEADEVLWVTQAAPQDWPAAGGLDTDADGFIRVGETLQSTSHPEVFAAGDVASMAERRLPKSGVFAVRQGPVLADNLIRRSCGRALHDYRPQRHVLALISTGDRRAIASRGRFAASGAWAWRWKDWIDRRFMARFRLDLERPMQVRAPRHRVPELAATGPDASMRCGGCGAKVGGGTLARVLQRLKIPAAPEALAGPGDDAALLRPVLNALEVQTVDGFRAMIADPYLVGRIGAEHAINDVYAMGGMPRTAMAWVSIPYAADALMEDDLYQVMAGALRAFESSGTALVGGHSSEADELAVGFAVSGTVDERDVWRKGHLDIGDSLIVTKPIGTGVLLAAQMRGRCRARWLLAALRVMQQSNREAARVLHQFGVSAVTDVTGFGLLGHMAEMADAARLAVQIDPQAVPALAGARESFAAGLSSSLQVANEHLLANIDIGDFEHDSPDVRLLFDPQTSGGLLVAVPAGRAPELLHALHAAHYRAAAIIGLVEAGRDGAPWARLAGLPDRNAAPAGLSSDSRAL